MTYASRKVDAILKNRVAVKTLGTNNTCREGTIYDLRQAMQNNLFKKETVKRPGSYPEMKLVQARVPILDHEKTLIPRGTAVRIQAKALTHNPLSKHPIAMANEPGPKQVWEFVEVADRIMGTVAVLLSPNRRQGNWWETDYTECVKPVGGQSHIHWYGSDGFFLQHPTLVALMTGLIRQVALLCQIGEGQKIIEAVSRDRINQILTEADWRLALEAAEALRPWIEVPVPRNGSQLNMPFPVGMWRRLQRLHRAARRHGYDAIFQQSFEEGWNLGAVGTNYSGMYSFWGEKGKETEHHRRVMKLGEPKRRSVKSGKSAAQGT